MEPAEGLSDSQLTSSSLTLLVTVTVTGGVVRGVSTSKYEYERVERGGGQQK